MSCVGNLTVQTVKLSTISLTATLGKVLESFVGEWILHRVSSRLDDRQYYYYYYYLCKIVLEVQHMHKKTLGLVPSSNVQRRTPWSTCYITGTLLSTRASRYALFVYFTKAFDHVDHNVLVSKLVALGLPDVIVRHGSAPSCDIDVSVSRSVTSYLTGCSWRLVCHKGPTSGQ